MISTWTAPTRVMWILKTPIIGYKYHVLTAENEEFILAAQVKTLFTQTYQTNVLPNGADPT